MNDKDDAIRDGYLFLSLLTSFSAKKLWDMIHVSENVTAIPTYPMSYFKSRGINFTEIEENQYQSVVSEEKVRFTKEELVRTDTHYICYENPLYPQNLKDDSTPPVGLFYKGSLPDPNKKKVAIVGSRRCSSYGRDIALSFSREFALNGVEVISGMALGIDGYAGEGALIGEKNDFAVLAGGVDRPYPMDNLGLYMELQKKGGILSERPLKHVPYAREFPLRNRIISGIADVLLVVEAAKKSGTQITVEYGIAQNKDIFAIPGRIDDPISEGTNTLIKNGALMATSPEDILERLGILVTEKLRKEEITFQAPGEKTVYKALSAEILSVDELLEKTGLPVSDMLDILLRLEMRGLVSRDGLFGYKKSPRK